MYRITANLSIAAEEVELRAISSRGPGGQHTNKAATAIHLRFDITRSSLPDQIKERLLALGDRRISRNGVVVIKADGFRSQEKNRDEALGRLMALIVRADMVRRRRKNTVPTGASREKRLSAKSRRARVKHLRHKMSQDNS